MPTPPDWILAEMSDGEHLARRVQAFRDADEYRDLIQGDDPYSGALAAVNIRRELRRAFPDVRFAVTRPRHGALRVAWRGGPTSSEVAGLTTKYASSRELVTAPGRRPRYTVWIGVFGGADFIALNRLKSANR